MALKLAVVEDDTLTRLSLVAALRSEGIEVVFDCGTAAEALALSEKHRFDVALLDMHLGKGPNGVDVAREYRKKQPGVGIVFLTSFTDPRLLTSGVTQLPGNSVYLIKSEISEIKLIVDSIYRAAVGKGGLVGSKLDSEFGQFTDTQIETLRLVALGYSNAEIAKKRFMTVGSVETSITRVAKALGLDKDMAKNQRVHMAQVVFRSTGQHFNED